MKWGVMSTAHNMTSHLRPVMKKKIEFHEPLVVSPKVDVYTYQ